MKNLITFLKLLFFPFVYFLSLKKELKEFFLTFFLSLIFIPISTYAASTTCPGANHNVSAGLSTITETSANNTNNYHQITIGSNGTLEIVFTNTEAQSSKTSTFYVGSSCTSISDIYNNDAGAAKVHTVSSFAVVAGQTIQLLVADTGNNEDYKIEFNLNVPPVADAGTDQTVPISSIVTLDGSGSSDANGGSLTYSWSLTKPTGSNATLSSTSAIQPTFTADLGGNYILQLIVNDGNFDSPSDTVTITAVNTKPVANAGADKNVITASLVTLDGSGSSDANGDSLTYSWSFTSIPSGSTATLLSPTAIKPTFTADTNGTYIIELIVNDGKVDSDADTVSITAAAVLPTDADLNITKTALYSGGVVTSVPLGENFQYVIDVGNSGPAGAENVVVTDVLPTDITYLTDGSDTNIWDCNLSSGTVTCNHEGNLSAAQTHTIILNVRAPSTEMTLTNNASVTSKNDPDSSNNSTSLNTNFLTEMKSAEHLCYASGALDTANCEKRGNFYYGNGCTATVMIGNLNTTSILTDLNVTKMYAPDLQSGTFTTTKGTPSSGGPVSISISDYISYTEGYEIDVGNFGTSPSDMNFTITDENSDSGSGANALSGIAMYGTYSNNGFNYSGRIFACDGSSESGIDIVSSADVIDTLITSTTLANNYNSSVDTSNTGTNIKYIQTMVAAQESREIVGVYLNLAGESVTYDYNGTVSRRGSDLPYSITPILANGDCSETYGNIIDPATDKPLVIDIPSGSYSGTGNMRVPNKVRKDARLKMIFIDPNTLSVDGQQCLDGSTTGNFDQLAQCVNSEVQYKAAFGQDAWDRCGVDSGKPCWSANHGSADTTDPTYDPNTDDIYVNPLGCYICTFNIQPTCSSDNFAIRPKAFDVNITTTTPLTIFKARKDTNLKFEALNDNNTTETYDYNETQDSSFAIDLNVSNNSGCPVKNLTISPVVTFEDGIHQGNFRFNDIGDINMSIHEINIDESITDLTQRKEFAEVDIDDTPTDDRLIQEYNASFRVIPDHFNIEANLTDHNTADNFTYLHDFNATGNYDEMSATLTVDINASGADGNITENYINGCYAKDTNLTLGINPFSITPTDAITKFLYYNPVEGAEYQKVLPSPQNITSADIPITNQKPTFDPNAPDGNGTASIEYKLNFDRNVTKVVNPFKIVLSDVNITDTDNVFGNDDVDQNATYYYGRSRASKFFYEDIETPGTPTPIIIDVYCGLPDIADCSSLGISTTSGKIFEDNWYVSTGHTSADGNITLMVGDPLIEGTGTPTVHGVEYSTPIDITAWSNGIDDTVIVHSDGEDVPLTVPIEIVRESDSTTPPSTFSNEWLIHYPDILMPPSPFYKVRFIGDSNWTGTGITGDVVNINASKKKSKRMDW